MKHIAVHGFSRRTKATWLCHGLGDRVAVVMMCMNYAKKHKTEVTLHINKEHAKAKASWRELIDLLPKNKVTLQIHQVVPMEDGAWIQYLEGMSAKGVSLYHFGDGLAPLADLCIHDYIKSSPKVNAKKFDVELPEGKFMVQQWDSRDRKRCLAKDKRAKVEQHFKNLGYELVTIGGEAKDPLLKNSLAAIAYAVKQSDGYVGVNSGMMWVSSIVKSFDNLWVWSSPKSDHVPFLMTTDMKINHIVEF